MVYTLASRVDVQEFSKDINFSTARDQVMATVTLQHPNIPTRWGGTYLYALYKGVPPPPLRGLGPVPVFTWHQSVGRFLSDILRK